MDAGAGRDLTGTRVLIAGCGDVGTALGLRLAARGAEVFGLRRFPGDLPAPLVPLAADLADADTLRDLPGDLSAVAYTAAADHGDETAYRRAYHDGLLNLLEALARGRQRPRRLLFTASTAVYGQTDGSWVDEDAPTEPTRFTGRVLLDAEAVLRDAPMPAVSVRLAGIYGPGRTRLVEQVRAGEATCPETPAYTNRIHRTDCAGVLAHLLELAQVAPVYTAADHDPADRCTVLRWLADRLGAPPPSVTPRPGRRGANKRVSNARLTGSGYRFAYPSFRDGYAEMLT